MFWRVARPHIDKFQWQAGRPGTADELQWGGMAQPVCKVAGNKTTEEMIADLYNLSLQNLDFWRGWWGVELQQLPSFIENNLHLIQRPVIEILKVLYRQWIWLRKRG
jgi:hypothetical protein